MFKKLKSLLVVSMLVFIGACADLYELEDDKIHEGNTKPNPDIPETEITPDNNVYEISTLGELVWVANKSVTDNFTGKTIRLMNDIDMENKKFSGIIKFAGRLEGNNKTISNVNLGDNGDNDIGLINKLEDGGHIENLTIASGIVSGDNRVGAFAGSIKGMVTLIGVKNNADVRGAGSEVGGFIGDSAHNTDENILTIENSSNGGKVTGDGDHVGGLIGMNDTTLKIINSSNNGVVSSDGGSVGGLVGRNYRSTTTINNSFNTSAINGVESIGGLVGTTSNNSNLTIKNSSNSGALTSVTYPIVNGAITGGSSVGGIIGFVGYSELSISNSLNTANISAEGQMIGGIVGRNWHSTIKIDNSSNSGDIVSTSIWGEVGGIVGGSSKSLTINNSANSGNLKAERNIGGIIGLNSGTATFTNVYSYAVKMTATGTATDSIGGIVGKMSKSMENEVGTVTAINSYWLYDATAEGSASGTGVEKAVGTDGKGDGVYAGDSSKALTIAEFKSSTNFNAWDFTGDTGIWIMGAEYPTIRNLPKP